MSGRMNGNADWVYPGLKVWTKESSINTPGPSQAFVFVDEDKDSIDSSSLPYGTLQGQTQVTGKTHLASRHGNGGNLSFADGHVENWRWVEQTATAV